MTTSDRLYPNLYVALVGHPGVGKTRTIMAARKFLAGLDGFHIAPTSMSKASLVDALKQAERHVTPIPPPGYTFNSLALVQDEWSSFMAEYDTALIGALTTFYDVTVPYRDFKRGLKIDITIERPQLNILAGSTPSNLIKFMPDYAWEQGFTSRIILIYSDYRVIGNDFARPTRVLPADMEYDIKVMFSLDGEFTVTEGYEKAVNAWRASHEEPKPTHPKLVHYNTRRRTHIYKLSMVSAVNRGNALRLEEQDFKTALLWLEEAELDMAAIFDAGSTVDSQAMDEIVEFVKRQGKPLRHYRIVDFARKRVPTHSVVRLLDVMLLAGLLREAGKDGDYVLYDVNREG